MAIGDYEEETMRLGIFLGAILGILLTVGTTYTFDTVTGRAASATSSIADDQRPMVNWDVVARDFNDLRTGVVEVGNRVHDGWKRLTS
jgi:hypothetical protein